MIENIYSNVAGKEKEYPVSGRKPPKNVRQIGTFSGDFRIYVEDYVHTFTHWLAEQDHTERCVAVLVGEFAKSEHAREVYAYGTVTAERACANGKIEMSAQVWTQIYETIKHYFPDGEIVGWFCGGTSFTAEEREEIFKVHLDHFAGADRILLLYDYLDQEEEFYRYGESGMARQEGYYIYYEKNTEMQNYMIDKKQGRGSEENVNDRAVREVRARWNAEKKELEEREEAVKKTDGNAPQGGGNRFLYSVGVVMTAVALVAAASMLYNQERLKGFEQTLNKLLGNTDEEGEPDTKEVSGKAKDGKEGQDGKEGEGNALANAPDKAGTMAWEITGSAPTATGKPGNEKNDPPSDMENTPDTQDGEPSVTGAAKTDDGNGGNSTKEGDGGNFTAGGDEKTGDGQSGTGQQGNENDGDKQSGTGQQGSENNSDGQSGSEQSGSGDNSDGQSGSEQSGSGDNSDGQSGTGSGGQSGSEQSGGGNNVDEPSGSGQTDDPESGQNDPDSTPKPGDAVQTGEIGGPGAAIDTSNMQIYTVKPGDTLISICRKFYGNLTNLEYIKELNQLNNENLIYVDQELLLP